MLPFKQYIKICTVFLLLLSFSCSATNPEMKAEKYIITAEENAKSERWAEYLFNHLSKRTNAATCVILQKEASGSKLPKGVKNIHLSVDADLRNDYMIKHQSDRLYISVRNDQTAVWIIYQLIDNIAKEDDRFNAGDIPPAIINFTSANVDFDFAYREPYFSPNLDPDYSLLIGTNHVENDWGIWGHGLSKTVQNKDNEQIYALAHGERNRHQFCFSSPDLLKALQEYIIDNFGYGDKHSNYFVIMPNDNGVVCTCPDCLQTGNTENNASPAVADFVRRLSEKFPKHFFFTTSYRTTKTLPPYQLPENAGVLFSTVSLPKGVVPDKQPQVKEFVRQLDSWKAKTTNIYLWDYAANFDDYLTPIPVLLSLQEQLKFFKRHGVKGIFLNASGYDYSPFDDVKTYVSAALMMNADADVESLVNLFFKRKYPHSHDLLSKYYMSLERQYFEKNKAYNIYGGIRETVRTYLNMDEFIHFYNALRTEKEKAPKDEREKLEKLYAALTFTRLQIAYIQGSDKWGYARRESDKMIVKEEISVMLDDLQQTTHFSDLQNYKEFGGNIAAYITQWQKMIRSEFFENSLMNTSVKILSEPDEGFEKTHLLNDGTPGFVQDYHQGWYLSSTDDLVLQFSTDKLQNTQKIQCRFLGMEAHKMFPPEHIETVIDGKRVDLPVKIEKQKSDLLPDYSMLYTLPVNLAGTKEITLKFIRRKAPKSILAIDEIQTLNY